MNQDLLGLPMNPWIGCPHKWPWQSAGCCYQPAESRARTFGRSGKVSPGTLSMFQTEEATTWSRVLSLADTCTTSKSRCSTNKRTSLAGCLRLILLRNHVRVHVKHPQSSQSQLLTCYYPLWLWVKINHPKMSSSHSNKDTYFAHWIDPQPHVDMV